jgi:formylmethanofuran dehydrogenase subunit B
MLRRGSVTADRVERHVTCLGCGCACDDIEVSIRGGRIADTGRACPLGAAWFGDGSAPSRARVDGRDASLADALRAAAQLLKDATRPLVYLAPGLSCESQRAAVGVADRCRAALDNISSLTVLQSVLAGQEIGRATATLGEVRNRADTVVIWDVDAARYPRLAERYATDPIGLDVPEGRRGRRVFSVTVRAAAWPDADQHVPITRADEVPTLEVLAALLSGTTSPTGEGQVWSVASALADALLTARYVALLADAEPVATGGGPFAPSARAAALWRVSHALNERTRGAVIALRAGGNRTGAESVMTSHTGYPMAVDFAGGGPRYQPHGGGAAARLAAGTVDAVLVAGDAGTLDASLRERIAVLPAAVLGPGATDGPLSGCHVAIDTARAGIHEAGTALRLDDVPLPLRALLEGPPSAAEALTTLAGLVA